jgi:hypothetical protein
MIRAMPLIDDNQAAFIILDVALVVINMLVLIASLILAALELHLKYGNRDKNKLQPDVLPTIIVESKEPLDEVQFLEGDFSISDDNWSNEDDEEVIERNKAFQQKQIYMKGK